MKKPDLLRRQQALEKTLTKYRRRAVDWKEVDCVRMLRSHLVAMGHRKVPKVPAYDSAAGAKRALKQAGFNSVEELLDSLLPRIPSASSLPGDVVLMEGEHGFDAVMLSVGQKVVGWHQDVTSMATIIPRQIKGAWRA